MKPQCLTRGYRLRNVVVVAVWFCTITFSFSGIIQHVLEDIKLVCVNASCCKVWASDVHLAHLTC